MNGLQKQLMLDGHTLNCGVMTGQDCTCGQRQRLHSPCAINHQFVWMSSAIGSYNRSPYDEPPDCTSCQCGDMTWGEYKLKSGDYRDE